jgi:hypothetical protein
MEKGYLDKNKSLEERKIIYRATLHKLVNPLSEEEFNPENFEPLASSEEKEVSYRKRVKPSKTLPTYGLKPKEILEGQMIGMYESKQDIYLIMAHRCNDMQIEIDELREEVKKLKDLLTKK